MTETEVIHYHCPEEKCPWYGETNWGWDVAFAAFAAHFKRDHGGTLNDYAAEFNAASRIAGWWDDESHYHPTMIKSQKIVLMHSELSEMLEGVRKSSLDDHLPNHFTEEVELADLILRALDYAGAYGINIEKIVREKLAYNAQRADHKLENRAKEGGKKF